MRLINGLQEASYYRIPCELWLSGGFSEGFGGPTGGSHMVYLAGNVGT